MVLWQPMGGTYIHLDKWLILLWVLVFNDQMGTVCGPRITSFLWLQVAFTSEITDLDDRSSSLSRVYKQDDNLVLRLTYSMHVGAELEKV